MKLHRFNADGAAQLGGPDWLRARRAAALEETASSPLPTEKDELWRYSPIDRLDLDDYAPALPLPAGGAGPNLAGTMADRFVEGLRSDLPVRSALVVLHHGWPIEIDAGALGPGVSVRNLAAGGGPPDGFGALAGTGDVFVGLNDAFLPDAVLVGVDDGVALEAPVVVVHWCDGAVEGVAPASFPRTQVVVGRGSQASVVEVVAGAPGSGRALVVPITELVVGEGSQLSYASMQVLGTGAWHVARLGASAGRDAVVRIFSAGLGAAYDRMRTDAVVTGIGASSELRSVYLGTGEQIHDVRTQQDHDAPRTTSNLLCKGAVAGSSRSVYSGMIRIRHGAVRSEAMQTNNNLVLDERAHADSVPNLDIEENDVRCSHASTVGPVDDEQQYYLETRGIAPDEAERLIVLGFFADIVSQVPVPAVAARLRHEVGIRLAGALGLDAGTGGLDGPDRPGAGGVTGGLGPGAGEDG